MGRLLTLRDFGKELRLLRPACYDSFVVRSQLRSFRRLIRLPSGHLPLEVCPAERRPRGGPAARRRDYLFHLAMRGLEVPTEQQGGEKEACFL